MSMRPYSTPASLGSSSSMPISSMGGIGDYGHGHGHAGGLPVPLGALNKRGLQLRFKSELHQSQRAPMMPSMQGTYMKMQARLTKDEPQKGRVCSY
jgi:hypothetical protein